MAGALGEVGNVSVGVSLNDRAFNTAVNRSVRHAEDAYKKSFGAIKKTAIGALAAIGVSFAAALPSATKRLDTLKNYENVMSNLGVGANAAKYSVKKLVEGLEGLPTTIDAASLAVQRLTAYNANIAASTEMYLAMNNAILAGSAPMEAQASAQEHLLKAYAQGKMDMDAWRSALIAMPAQLKQVGIAMGYANLDNFGEALRSGSISMNDFMRTMMRLNKEGVDGFLSFEEQARNSTGGIGTSMQNLKTAFSRGLANIMDAIGQSNIAKFFDMLRRGVDAAAGAVVSLINKISALLAVFGLKAPEAVTTSTSTFDGASESLGSLAVEADDAIGNLNGVGGAAKKAAKEARKALGGLDELNILRTSVPDSGGGGDGGNGGAGAFGDFTATAISDVAEEANSGFDRLLSKVEKLFGLFKEGFAEGFGGTTFDNIYGHIDNIKAGLRDIFTDSRVVGAAKEWADTVAMNLGKITGSFASMGVTVGENVLGGIDKYLQQNSGRVKEFIVSMFDINADVSRIYGDFSVAIADIFSVFRSDKAKQVSADLIAMIVNPLMSVWELSLKTGKDIIDAITFPFVDNKDKIKKTVEELFEPLQGVTSTVSEALTYMGDKLNEVYDNYISPFIESLKIGLSDTFGKFLDYWNEYVSPFLERVSEGFSDTWETHLKPMLEKFGEYIGSVMEALKVFWEKTLKPLIDWIVKNILPKVIPILERTWNTVKFVFDLICDIIGIVMGVMGGLIDFLVGIFTGDWEKAWEGVKKIFGSIWDGIKKIFEGLWDWFQKVIIQPIADLFFGFWDGLCSGADGALQGIKNIFGGIAEWFKETFSKAWNGVKDVFSTGGKIFTGIVDGITNVFKTVVNGIIGGLNKVVKVPFDGINSALSKIRNVSILGISPFGFLPTISTPQIPLLAQGAYMPANNPRLAIVGDNRREGEIIAPESKIYENALRAVKDAFGHGSGNGGNLKLDITIRQEMPDGRTIIKVVNDLQMQDGYVSLIAG
jgi:tape measure domain-containing protein